MEEYVEAILAVCAKHSVPVLDLYHGGGITVLHSNTAYGLLSDGLHPNDAGHRLIARKVRAFIETL
jgi:lysophospholipase L1-like esterase